jgi:translation initiation factor 3 subunit D
MSNSFDDFELPEVQDSPFGWGPSSCASIFKDVPFVPYNKADRLMKVSDWTQNKWRSRGPTQYGGGQVNSFAYKHDEDDASFSLVNNSAKPKLMYGQYRRVKPQFNRGGWSGNRVGRGGAQQQWGSQASTRGNGRGGARGGVQPQRGGRGGRGAKTNNFNSNARGGKWNFREEVIKEASLAINDKWEQLETIDIDSLTEERINPGSAEELIQAGTLEKWNDAYERITLKQPKLLNKFENCEHYTATTSADPYIKEIAEGQSADDFVVYATDSILGLLMSTPKSVNSWDILVRKTKNALYFDKRSDSKVVDFLSVNENLKDNNMPIPEKDSINSPELLSVEATEIQKNFLQQVIISGQGKEQGKPSPLESVLKKGQIPASTVFRYRKWNLPEYSLVVRTQLNSYMTVRGEDVLVTAKVLNEFDSRYSGGVDWRQKLEQQSGSVLANETKNNAHRLSRLSAEAFLSGADVLQLGWASRNQSSDPSKHYILKVIKYEPKVFAKNCAISIAEHWGVLKSLVDVCMRQDVGKYILLRDPNQQEVQLYKVAPDQWEDETGVFKHAPLNE